jgi:uncharacterized small protein (DUF1192 family)
MFGELLRLKELCSELQQKITASEERIAQLEAKLEMKAKGRG